MWPALNARDAAPMPGNGTSGLRYAARVLPDPRGLGRRTSGCGPRSPAGGPSGPSAIARSSRAATSSRPTDCTWYPAGNGMTRGTGSAALRNRKSMKEWNCVARRSSGGLPAGRERALGRQLAGVVRGTGCGRCRQSKRTPRWRTRAARAAAARRRVPSSSAAGSPRGSLAAWMIGVHVGHPRREAFARHDVGCRPPRRAGRGPAPAGDSWSPRDDRPRFSARTTSQPTCPYHPSRARSRAPRRRRRRRRRARIRSPSPPSWASRRASRSSIVS